MCGSYYLDVKRHADLNKILKDHQDGDIFPGKYAPIIYYQQNSYHVSYLKWGYPMKDKLIYNARCETILEKDFFISIFTNRCLVPVSGFYEWTTNKTKYAFELDKPFYLAGIYQDNHFCIITTPANFSVKTVHIRMPLIINGDDIHKWFSEDFDQLLKTNNISLIGIKQ